MKRNSTADKEHIDYFMDKALDTKNDDKFKHSHYVKVLKGILLRSETPINIGLYGKWGVGKSSIVHMLKEAIEKDEKLKDFKYAEIDAWRLSDTSLRQGLLEEINAQLGPVYKSDDLEDKLYNTQQVDVFSIHTLKKLRWMIPLVGVVATILALGNSLGVAATLSMSVLVSIFALLFKLILGSSKKTIAKATSSIQFSKIYDEILKQQEGKIVIVIDNLDRCNDEVAVELLGLIQTFMVKENCINIPACADEALIRHLRNVKGKDYTEKDGNEFLSKFFQVTLRIPPFIGENLEEYAEGLMNSRSVEFDPVVRQILISGAVENPRKINQFLNNAVALYRLAELKERDQKLPQGAITQHTDFLTKMIIIRHEWPEFYKKMEEEPDILNDQGKRSTWLGPPNSDRHMAHRALEKFLYRTQVSHVDDVVPFLRLNQESYAAESGIDEFGTAIATLDPVAGEMFSKADPQKQKQCLKKADEVMDRYAEKSDSLTLVNCALSLIRILKLVQDSALREIALATLGKHLSNHLLDQWHKFDLDDNMFGLLEGMKPHFSRTFYEKMIADSLSKDKMNQEMFAKFLRNGGKISSEIMDYVDSAFSKVISEPLDNLEILAQCCSEYGWEQNNITKPSGTVSAIIESITFAPDGSDNPFLTTYKKIEKRIAGSERGKFLERVRELFLQFTKGNQAMPEPLVAAIQKVSQSDPGENLEQKERIFETLARSIKRIPDSGQRDAVLDVLHDLAEKLSKTANVSCDIGGLLESAAAQYLGDADGDMILGFFKKAVSGRADLLKSDAVMSALIERFASTDPGNEETLRFLLKNTPAETQNTVAEKLSELILSGEEAKYSALLRVAQELDEDFNPATIDSVRKACIDAAAAKDGSDRVAWYLHVLKLKPTFSEVDDIIKYAEELIQENDYGLQDRGLELLKAVNSDTDQFTHNALEIAIEKSTEFLRTDLERMAVYLNFVFQYPDRWTYRHRRKLKEFFQEGLKPGQAESNLNHIIENINRSTPEIIRDILDEMIDCARQTPFDNVKKQLRDVLVNNKSMLDSIQKEKIKEIYGDIGLD